MDKARELAEKLLEKDRKNETTREAAIRQAEVEGGHDR